MGLFGFNSGLASNNKKQTSNNIKKPTVETVKNNSNPIPTLINSAKEGNAQSAIELNKIFVTGKYGEKNLHKAFFWARYAADLDNAWGTYLTGYCMENGQGTMPDKKQAWAFYEKAMRLGCKEAVERYNSLCDELVVYLDNEEGLSAADYLNRSTEKSREKDFVGAFNDLLTAASIGNNTDAMNILGLAYRQGNGVDKDYYLAAYWMKKAADNGNVFAAYNLAGMYASARGVCLDYAEASRLYQLAASKGHTIAHRYFGKLNELLNADKTTISNLAAKACRVVDGKYDRDMFAYYHMLGVKKGSIQDNRYLALNYCRGYGVERNYVEALYYFGRRLLFGKDAISALHIAIMLHYGMGGLCNPTISDQYYKLAIQQSDSPEKYTKFNNVEQYIQDQINKNEMTLYLEGKYVFPNLYKAIENMKEAAQQGKNDAKVELAVLYAMGWNVLMDCDKAMEYIDSIEPKIDKNGINYVEVYREGILRQIIRNRNSNIVDSFEDDDYESAARDMMKLGFTKAARGFLNHISKHNPAFNVDEAFDEMCTLYGIGNVEKPQIQEQPAESEIGSLGKLDSLKSLFSNERIATLLNEARQGNVSAMKQLSDNFASGNGTVVNEKIAYFFSRLALDYGDYASACTIASMYENGKGVRQDMQKAFAYYQYASNHSVPGAYDKMQIPLNTFDIVDRDNLGMSAEQLYENALDEDDLFVAARFFRKAATLDHVDSMVQLAQLYLEGSGVQKNYPIAFYWLDRAATIGSAEAIYFIASLYEKGDGLILDPQRALELFVKLYEADRYSQTDRKRLLESRINGNIEDIVKTAESLAATEPFGYGPSLSNILYRWAAYNNNAKACFELAKLYEDRKDRGIELIDAIYYMGKALFLNYEKENEAYTILEDLIGQNNLVPTPKIDLRRAVNEVNEVKASENEYINRRDGLLRAIYNLHHYTAYEKLSYEQLLYEASLAYTEEFFEFVELCEEYATQYYPGHPWSQDWADRKKECDQMMTYYDSNMYDNNIEFESEYIKMLGGEEVSLLAAEYTDDSVEVGELQSRIDDNLPENLDAYFEGMVGMDKVKEELDRIYQSVKMQILRNQIRVQNGEEPIVDEKGYNFLLLGNPGTGKTTVARIIAQILYDIKIRTSNSFLEVERSGMISDHIGGTEERMRDILSKINGGTLFIDEAYSLYREDSDNDFGQAAIDVLMKDMEDHRDSYSVIMAGYRNPMMNMIRNSNSGFSSRFAYIIDLPDYEEDALIEMAHIHIEKNGMKAVEGVDDAIRKCIAHDKIDETFGNARYIRELVNRAIENQSQRLCVEKVTNQNELFELKPSDFWQGEMDEKNISDYLEELNSLIGLGKVKEEVNSLINQIVVQKEMEKRSLNLSGDFGTLHMAFKGNPGTGKTTVARIIGKLYTKLGVLKRDDIFVECSRADLVGSHMGETAIKTRKVVQSALGGILFIDEAYSLVQDSRDSFGLEAVSELVTQIENNRNNLLVILAGYNQDIDDFLKNNPGLRSRVPVDLTFDDYNLIELNEIALDMLKKKGLKIDEKGEEALRGALLRESLMKDFGNARGVRNLIDKIARNQNVRMAGLLSSNSQVTDDELLTVIAEDIEKK